MSILESNKLDVIAAQPGSDVVKLVITDHLSWDDFAAHAHLLQAKVNAYLEFIESGQLNRVQSPRIPASPDIWISVAMQHPPTGEAEEFLSRVEEFLRGMRISFEWVLRAKS